MYFSPLPYFDSCLLSDCHSPLLTYPPSDVFNSFSFLSFCFGILSFPPISGTHMKKVLI